MDKERRKHFKSYKSNETCGDGDNLAEGFENS